MCFHGFPLSAGTHVQHAETSAFLCISFGVNVAFFRVHSYVYIYAAVSNVGRFWEDASTFWCGGEWRFGALQMSVNGIFGEKKWLCEIQLTHLGALRPTLTKRARFDESFA